MSAQTYNIRRRSSWSVFLACIVAVLTLSACTQHTDEISDTEKEYVRNLISEAKSNADRNGYFLYQADKKMILN